MEPSSDRGPSDAATYRPPAGLPPVEASGTARGGAGLRWLLFLVPLLAMGSLLVLDQISEDPVVETTGDPAPPFALPTTDGGEVSLAELSAGGDVLLFFSMGVGCDSCFWQVTELEPGLAERGIELGAVMVDDPGTLAVHAERLGVERPILADTDASVSAAYGMLGQYGHTDVPSHSFALVRDGVVAWTRHDSSMFVPADVFFADLDTVL